MFLQCVFYGSIQMYLSFMALIFHDSHLLVNGAKFVSTCTEHITNSTRKKK